MAESMKHTSKRSQSEAQSKTQSSKATPSPPRLVRLRLESIGDVRREMARLYCAMRGGVLEEQRGCRLAYVLTSVGKLIETEILESRVAALEQEINHGYFERAARRIGSPQR